MRVIAGIYRGRRLVGPPGDRTRPTSDRAKEALFSALGPIDGLAVLDLFAGSGALGIESLSRGASSVVFVERAAQALGAIQKNLSTLRVPEAMFRVERRDALQTVERYAGVADLVFADPPYDQVPRVAARLLSGAARVLAPGGRLILEHSSDFDAETLSSTLAFQGTRRYGAAAFSFFEAMRNPVNDQKTKLAARIQQVKPSATLVLTQTARDLRAQGFDILSLTAGEPDLPPAQHVLDAMKAAIDRGETRYTNVGGIAELREAICAEYKTRDGLDYEPEDVVVSCGAKQAVYNACQVLVDPGCEVIIPAPFWVSYQDIVRLADGVPKIVDTGDTGFILTAEQLRAAITPKTRALFLNSPSNPTGAAYTEAQLKALAEVLEDHPHIVVLADEIYRRFVYGGRESAATLLGVAPQLKDRVLIIDGCSKTFAMTGIRIGWATGPRTIVKAMTKLQGQSTSNPAAPSQYGALAALTGDQAWVQDMVKTFDERRAFVVAALREMDGIECFDPQGAFYAFPSIAGLLGRTTPEGKRIESASDVAEYLLKAHHLVVVPGEPFGAPKNFRMSFATDMKTLEGSMARLRTAVGALT